MRKYLILFLLFASPAFGQIKTITGGGYQYPNGNPCAGCTLTLQLTTDATVSGTGQIVPKQLSYILDANGNVPASSNLWGNDQVTPNGTTYKASLAGVGGGQLWGPEYLFIAGPSPINLAQLIPVASPAVFFTNPTGLVSSNTASVTANASVSGTQNLQNSCSAAPCFAAGALNSVTKTFNMSWAGSVQYVNSTETVTWSLSLNGGVSFPVTIASYVPAGTSLNSFSFTVECTVVSPGSSGQLDCLVNGFVGDGTTFGGKANAPTSFLLISPVNLTAVVTPQIGISFSTASTSNTAISQLAFTHVEN